jgi:hypothetical protein
VKDSRERIAMEPFGENDAGVVKQSAHVREKARELVDLWARKAALELAKHRGARLSNVRELWDRCGFFLFIEPLGNSWMGVDLSPAHPLTGRYAAPRGPLSASLGRLNAEGMVEEGDELAGRVVLPAGRPIAEVAEQTFAPLWRWWDLCHGLANVEDGG